MSAMKSKIIQITDAATITQMQDSMNTQMASGWILISVFQRANGDTFAVFTRREA